MLGGPYFSEIYSVIYQRNREEMNFPFLEFFFTQVLLGSRYKQFCDFEGFSVRMSFFTWESINQLWGHVFSFFGSCVGGFDLGCFILSSSVQLGEDFSSMVEAS